MFHWRSVVFPQQVSTTVSVWFVFLHSVKDIGTISVEKCKGYELSKKKLWNSRHCVRRVPAIFSWRYICLSFESLMVHILGSCYCHISSISALNGYAVNFCTFLILVFVTVCTIYNILQKNSVLKCTSLTGNGTMLGIREKLYIIVDADILHIACAHVNSNIFHFNIDNLFIGVFR